MLKDFAAFLKEYNIVTMAIAFIMGAASNSLVKSLVDDLIMPLFNPLFSNTSWDQAVLQLGPIALRWGAFVSELLHFLILAFVIYIIVRKIMKKNEAPGKKK